MPRSVFTSDYHTFREMLVDARKQTRMTQNQLAARLRRPQSFVSKYERGERRLDVVEFLQIASALGKDPAAFLKQLKRKLAKREK